MSNTPILSDLDEKRAPWNAKDSFKKIKVCVSITLSKEMEIEISDYIAADSIDENNNVNTECDYSNCNLEEEVKLQHILPHDIYKYLPELKWLEGVKKEASNWQVDDVAVIPE